MEAPTMFRPLRTDSKLSAHRNKISVLVTVLAIGLMLAPFSPSAQADPLFGPIMDYDSFTKSPFFPILGTFDYFHLIKMSDLTSGLPMTAPGATASAGFVDGPGGLIDSVDGENAGHSLFSGDGTTGITFTFDKAVLGNLPTDVGIAWTDGYVPIHFSAIDANGNSLGQIDDSTCCDFSTGDGNPANYRLFYVIDAAGISSIHISNTGGGIEVDHLQYGFIAPVSGVPEPATFLLLGSALCAVGYRLRRRRS
jgi:hypothetical protein